MFKALINHLLAGKKCNIQQYMKILNFNNFMKIDTDLSCFKKILENIIFVNKFTCKQSQQNEGFLTMDWTQVSNLKPVLIKYTDQINEIIEGGNLFKKTKKLSQIEVSPSQYSKNVQKVFTKLWGSLQSLQEMKKKSKNKDSQYFIDKTIQVYDKTIQQSYEDWQSYVRYETRKKNVDNYVPVTKTKKVTKYRPVTKYRSQSYSVAVTSKNYFTKIVTLGIGGNDVQYQQRTRSIPYESQEPYQEDQHYQQQQNHPKEQEYQFPINDKRKVTKTRPKQIFKDQLTREFDKEKYEKQFKEKEGEILKLKKDIQNILSSVPKGKVGPHQKDPIVFECAIQQETAALMAQWQDTEYQAYFNESRNKSNTLEIGEIARI